VTPAVLLALIAASSTSSIAPPLPEPLAFAIDPLADGTVIGASLAFGILLEVIVRTGELRPQEPGDPSVLLGIDRPFALKDDYKDKSDLLSDIGIALAGTYAAVDITLTAFLDRGESPLAYGFMYLETAAINLALQNLVKIAVRRPRPAAYRELRLTGMVSTETNSALAFYSGHTAVAAGIAATATYLAFERSLLEGLITLGGGLILTTLIGVQRVQAGEHFPTDVIAGALAGAGVGVLVPHLHRTSPTLRVQVLPMEEGGMIAFGGTF